MTRRIGYIFGVLAPLLYQGPLLIHRILKPGNIIIIKDLKHTSTKNSGPGSLLMQVL